MKKTILTMSVLLMLITACRKTETHIPVLVITFDTLNGSSDNHEEINQYNQSGMPTKTIVNVDRYRYSYQYDANNLLTKQTVLFEDNSQAIYTYIHNAIGKLIQIEKKDENGVAFSYDTFLYYADYFQVHSYGLGVLSDYKEYYYSMDRKNISYVLTYSGTGGRYSRTDYTYDNKKNPLLILSPPGSSAFVNSNNALSSITTKSTTGTILDRSTSTFIYNQYDYPSLEQKNIIDLRDGITVLNTDKHSYVYTMQ